MKIVRVLWGNSDTTWNEIPEKPLFDNEIVYVWGTENQARLISRGYNTIILGPYITQPEYSNIYTHFVHKLHALSVAEKDFEEYLFLDWDVNIVKKIDDQFWDLIRSNGPIQIPTYSYPKGYESVVSKFLLDNPENEKVKNLDPNIIKWINVQNTMLEKYSWDFEDINVVPNFCFFYSNGTNAISKLMEIYRKYNIKTCIEEFCMFIFANCTLEDFINTYEPLVINGCRDDYHHFDNLDDYSILKINQHVKTIIYKNIYLVHQ